MLIFVVLHLKESIYFQDHYFTSQSHSGREWIFSICMHNVHNLNILIFNSPQKQLHLHIPWQIGSITLQPYRLCSGRTGWTPLETGEGKKWEESTYTFLFYKHKWPSLNILHAYFHQLGLCVSGVSTFLSPVSHHQWGCVCSSPGGCSESPPACRDSDQPAGRCWWSPGISGSPAWRSLPQPDRNASTGPGRCDVLLGHFDNSRGRQRHMDQRHGT